MKPNTIVLTVALSILLSGCIDMKNPPQPVDYYTFEYSAPQTPEAISTAYILKIEPFHVSPVYDDNRFLFRAEAFKRNEFSRHRWRANPGDLVADHLAQDLARTGFLRAVIVTEQIPAYTHILTGTIEEFYQRVEADEWQAVLSVSVLLVDESTGPAAGGVLFQNRYSFRETLADKTPTGFVDGMSRAMQHLSETLIQDVYTALTGDVTTGTRE